MSPLLRVIARYAARKLASDPEAKDRLIGAARAVARETGQVARHDDPAYAAGRAVRRALENLRSRRG
jgi:hypothetical protein